MFTKTEGYCPTESVGGGSGLGGGAAPAAGGAAAALDLTTPHIPPWRSFSEEIQGNGERGEGLEIGVSLGGTLCKLKGKGVPGGVGGGMRGKISNFSSDSRRRLLQLLGSLDRTVMDTPLFVGLTYPGVGWSDDPAIWHDHLEAFWKRLKRRYPAAPLAVIWRMEPQKRGAPHFHLLIFGVPSGFLPYSWVGLAWSSIVGGDEVHQKRCMRVERVGSWRGVMSYAAKYLGKMGGHRFVDSAGVTLEEVGRLWGVKGRQYLPVQWARYLVTLKEFHSLRRCIANYMRSKGRGHRVRGRWSGVWCFLGWEEALRLVGLLAPYAQLVEEVAT